jgi:hypothetical protein
MIAMIRVVRGTPLRLDVVLLLHIRGSPGREASARALLARSLIGITSHGDADGIGTTEWQLGVSTTRGLWKILEERHTAPHFT